MGANTNTIPTEEAFQQRHIPISELPELSDADRHINMGVSMRVPTQPQQPVNYTGSPVLEQIEWVEPVPKQHTQPKQSKQPFTPAEEEIQQLILKAQVLFIALPDQNKNAALDFLAATRTLRRIMAMRIIRRQFPNDEAES